jgi:AraC-like DNA-binding protein
MYRYKLEGYDDDWKDLSGDNPYVMYANLPSGKYRFYLKAANNDGVWSKEDVFLNINVRFSFFTEGTLKFSMSILIVLILIFGKLIVNRKKRQRQYEAGFKRPEKKERLVKTDIDPEDQERVIILDKLMVEEELYLDPLLSLNHLSDKLNISNNHLSVLLNDYIGKSFYGYVNTYRIEEIKKRLEDPKYNHQTLSSIGLDCGFNSKSAFNRIFKKRTDKTPSEYKSSVIKKT